MKLRPLLLAIPILISYLFVAIFNYLKVNSLRKLFKSIGNKLTNIAFK